MRARLMLISLVALAWANQPARADIIPNGRHPDVGLLPRGLSQLYDDTTLFTQPTTWRQIPWLTSLDDAIATSKKEKLPILIWVAGDDPLERC